MADEDAEDPIAGGDMEDAEPEKVRRETSRPKPAAEIRRTNIAFNVALQIICALLLFYMANHLGSRYFLRADLSASKKYTISEDSAAYLERLDTEVKLTMVYSSGWKIRNQLSALLEEYSQRGGSKVSFTSFNPLENPDRAAAFANRYKMPVDLDTVYIDVAGKLQTITSAQMMRDNGRLFAGEAAITAAIGEAVQDGPRTVYFIAGKGKLPEFNGRTALEELIDLSQQQFFRLKEFTLGSITRIPDDADAVLLINPESNFSQSEMAILREYWEEQQGSMVLLLNPATPMPNLFAFLRARGVLVRDDLRVLFSETTGIGGSRTVYAVQSTYLGDSPVTSGREGATASFGGQSCPLEIAENHEGLAAKGIVAKALLRANPKFWGDSEHDQAIPKPTEGDLKAPIYVAASIERGGSTDERVRINSSRLVVVGNPTLLDPEHFTIGNATFVLNSLNWALDRPLLLDIVPSPALNYRIDMPAEKLRRIFLLVVMILPAAAACFAIFVWSARRN